MSKPFRPDIPVNPETFLFNTLHMSAEEFGAFSLLAYHSWREDPPCSIPNDDSTLARIARLSDERWAACKHRVLAAFTSGSASRLYHKELRQIYDKLRRKHAARVSAANVAINSRYKKPNGMNGFHTNGNGLLPANVYEPLQQNVTIPPHPPREEYCFSLSSEEQNSKASTVVTPLDDAVRKISESMYLRHPAIRRCSRAVIQKQLRAIVRKINSVPIKIAELEKIDSAHKGWCETWDWTKDGGQYAKSLERWLAPTMERWEPPPKSCCEKEIDYPQ